MSSLLRKKVQVGKYSIPALALLLMIVGSVIAAAYIALTFIITTTVQIYPKVTFWQWSTSQKKNTFDQSLNIFAGIKTVDENATHGIFNDDSAQHQCYLRIKSLSNSANIAKLNITIYNRSDTIFTSEWSDFSSQPTEWKLFTTAANSRYAVWIEIAASSSATPSSSSQFEMEIKEVDP